MDSDLISRAEAIEIVRSLQVTLGGKEILHPEAKKSVLNALDDIPAADAEHVRHGRWIDVWIRGVLHHRCTECDSYIEHIWTGSLDFDRCPKCGAKMDAEVKE